MKELAFLAGNFFNYELPRERLYLLKYYNTPLEQLFLSYYYCFGEYEYFTDHTGQRAQQRWLKHLVERHDKLVIAHDNAKKEVNLELLTIIETGKFEWLS